MAKENERLKDRIKQLEEALESANTLLQLVMCEQNHLRDLRNKANDRIKRLEEAGDLMVQHFYTDEPRSEMWEKAKEAKP
jgi:LPS O-antigen subunit length determinant protein (WzzB/FepE family)